MTYQIPSNSKHKRTWKLPRLYTVLSLLFNGLIVARGVYLYREYPTSPWPYGETVFYIVIALACLSLVDIVFVREIISLILLNIIMNSIIIGVILFNINSFGGLNNNLFDGMIQLIALWTVFNFTYPIVNLIAAYRY